MAAQNGASPPQRSGFFKILFPSPSAKLQIPRKFHSYLPSKLPKSATLFCPHAEFWYVDICQTGQGVFFQRGWSEFVKAHDLQNGYLLIFRYNGNMTFEVEVFDTSCCPKDYSLKHCTRLFPSYTEIEDYSGSEDISLGDESYVETHLPTDSVREEKKYATGRVQIVVKEQINAQEEQTTETHFRNPSYIEIEESPESETKKFSKESHDSVTERSNSSDSDDKEKEAFVKDPRVIQMNVQNKKNTKITQKATNCTQFEKILTPAMVRGNNIIVPKAFCVKNNLVANCAMFLKRKLKGKVVPNQWMVGFSVEATVNKLRKGWRVFCKENSLNIGDKCIFQLVSKDTFLVETRGLSESPGGETMYVNGTVRVSKKEKRPPQQHHNVQREKMIGSSCKRSEYIEIEDLSESRNESISRVSDGFPGNYFSKRRRLSNSQGKNILKIDPNSNSFTQFEKILTRAAVESSSIYLPMAFCMKNDIVTTRTIFLKRKLEGGNVVPGKWPVQLYCGPSYCRTQMGWRKFSTENSLKAGNRCIFQLVSKDTFLVQMMPIEGLSTKGEKRIGYQRACSPDFASMKKQIKQKRTDPGNNLQCERIIKRYNLKSMMSLPKTFCLGNGLISEKTIFLKRSIDEKTWSVQFHPREFEGQLRTGWIDFARENGLEEGDQCTFQLMSENTFQVNIVRKHQKEMLAEKNWRSGMETIIAESEISLMVRQYHLTYNYMGIPLSFCWRNKLTSSRQMVLKAPDEKVWHVNFLFDVTREGRFKYDGWRKFASENALKAGDTCLLKLVDEKTMFVQIIKAEF